MTTAQWTALGVVAIVVGWILMADALTTPGYQAAESMIGAGLAGFPIGAFIARGRP